jgi:hypothetical protein
MSSVAPAHHPRPESPGGELPGQSDYHRGFAVAPHHDIAYHHYRNAAPVRGQDFAGIKKASQADNEPEYNGKGPEQPFQWTVLKPDFVMKAHGRFSSRQAVMENPRKKS